VSAPPAEEAWSLGLARLAALLGRDLQRAARALGGPAALWGAPADALAAALRLDAASARAVAELRAGFDAAAARAELCAAGLGHVGAADAAFPDRLRAIFDPPFGLFTRGDAGPALARLAAGPAVAVVGSRRATPAGRRLAHELAAVLAARGATVVSGLAQGIDAAAHTGALEAGGLTVAVLGAGLDVPYPRRNQALARTIVARGLLLSEYWPGTPPAPWRFPARNRVVAGLADAVAVVEAGRRSGALITADFALEQGRPVLAVPGWPGAVASAGCNGLLRAGAALLEEAADVVAELPDLAWRVPPPAPARRPEGLAGRAHDALRRRPLRPDELSAALGAPPGEVAAALALLELEGFAVRGEAGRFWATPRGGAGAGAPGS
jgi:DNA processing protein